MFPIPKQVIAISPSAVTNGGTATGYIDRKGYDYAVINIHMTTADDTTNKPSVLTIRHGSTTVVTNGSTFSGCVSGTDYTIPDAVTSGNNNFQFCIDCRRLERYLSVHIVPRTNQTITAIANLFKGDEMPTNSTEAGVKLLHVCN